MNFKKTSKFFNKFLNYSIINIECDGKSITYNEIIGKELKGDLISVYFDNGFKIKFSVDEYPHYFGQTDIIFEAEQNKELNEKRLMDIKVDEFRFWFFNKNNIFGYKSKNINQIEFYNSGNCVITLSLLKKTNQKIEYLISGELFISTKTIDLDNFDKRFSKE